VIGFIQRICVEAKLGIGKGYTEGLESPNTNKKTGPLLDRHDRLEGYLTKN